VCVGDSFGLFPKIGRTDKVKNTLLISIYVEHQLNDNEILNFKFFKNVLLSFLGFFLKNPLSLITFVLT
jgi:hypothetical protein